MSVQKQTPVGRIWKFGDNISTDHILPSRFMTQVKPNELAANCLAGADPEFAKKVQQGDIVAAGFNIGYGSSREQAPQALKWAGVSAVIAKSFARIFYRNCYNVGVPAIVCPQFVEESTEMDLAEINLEEGIVTNLATGKEYRFVKPPAFLVEYIRLGGLIPYVSEKLANPKTESI
ncbi:3-isopropylmalate dehydratase small subunit [Acetonema longum]|uniref:3-isopropylmalate dehydratase small subunit n=1 Tax=Acetonema longum DSM 6540 TaxID=1009370 RepID=F7NFD8_9FIRM|nr:3-isopropylmalate dehydratase small subunit [Acetonema longum]EGO65263.1 3-isopropylmalate dehydratase, small subunit [Acetonema longum DSM 6540]